MSASAPYTTENLAKLYEEGESLAKDGQYDTAFNVLEHVYKGRLSLLGREHPDTIQVLLRQGYIRVRQEQWADAERLYRDVLNRRESVYGTNSPETFSTLFNLVYVLQPQGKLVESESLARTLLPLLEAGGSRPGPILGLKRQMITLCAQTGRLDEARKLWEDTYRWVETMPDPLKTEELEALDELKPALGAGFVGGSMERSDDA